MATTGENICHRKLMLPMESLSSHGNSSSEPASSWADQKEEEEEEEAALLNQQQTKEEMLTLKARVSDLELDVGTKQDLIEKLESKVSTLEVALESLKHLAETDARLFAIEQKLQDLGGQAAVDSGSHHPTSPPPSADHEIPQFNVLEEEPVTLSPSSSSSGEDVRSVRSTHTTEETSEKCNSTTSKDDNARVLTNPIQEEDSSADSSPPFKPAPFSAKAKLAQQAPPPPAPVITFPGKNKTQPKGRANPVGPFVVIPAIDGAGGWSTNAKAKDIRDMSKEERSFLIKGETVAIHIGAKIIPGVPKRMLMQVSPKAAKFFMDNKYEKSIQLDADAANVAAISHIVGYLKDVGTSAKVFSIPLRGDNFQQNMLVRQAARTLDMERYVGHFTKNMCELIRNGKLNLTQVHQLLACFDSDDTIVDCLVNNLAHDLVKKGGVQPPPDLKKFLDHHQTFAKAVESSYQQILSSRHSRSRRVARQQSRSPSASTASAHSKESASSHTIKEGKNPHDRVSHGSGKVEASPPSAEAVASTSPNGDGNKKKLHITRAGKVKGGAFGKSPVKG